MLLSGSIQGWVKGGGGVAEIFIFKVGNTFVPVVHNFGSGEGGVHEVPQATLDQAWR